MATGDVDTSGPRLPATDLAELLQLLKGADSCELKLTVPAPDRLATIRSLPLDPVEAQPRQVFLFDTPDQAFQVAAESRAYLAQHGISLGGPKQTKTKAALEFFARELAAAGSGEGVIA